MRQWQTGDFEGRLFDCDGRRLYLRSEETRRFLRAASGVDVETRAFCQLLAFTGCRLSEALELTADRLDRDAGTVMFRTLKRRRVTYRAVPVPAWLVEDLASLKRDGRLWPWCRQTGWRRVRSVMASAAIDGPHASPKGLRHAFGMANAEHNVPPGLTQRWMGHARLETTTIYQQARGHEERAFAKRVWRDHADDGTKAGDAAPSAAFALRAPPYDRA